MTGCRRRLVTPRGRAARRVGIRGEAVEPNPVSPANAVERRAPLPASPPGRRHLVDAGQPDHAAGNRRRAADDIGRLRAGARATFRSRDAGGRHAAGPAPTTTRSQTSSPWLATLLRSHHPAVGLHDLAGVIHDALSGGKADVRPLPAACRYDLNGPPLRCFISSVLPAWKGRCRPAPARQR